MRGGGSNTSLKKCKISLVSIFLFSVSFGVADSYLDERLQKLEKQRQSLEAKIQKEAQNKEIKAQKQAKAREEREQKEARAREEKQRKERQAQENRQAKQAQKRELRETKRQQREFYKDESTALSGATSTSQESRRLRHTQYAQSSIYTSPNDINGWFIALAPKVEVIFIYADIHDTRYRFNAEYGATLEAGYLFGSGANRWRTYFSLGYGYGRSSDIAYRYDYYGGYYDGYNTEVIVDIHNITHNVGIDWIPRLGSSSARGVLGFYNSFSYIAMSERYEKYNLSRQCVPNGALWGSNCMIGGTQGSWQTTPIPAGEAQDFIHIFFIGIGTRLGVIFDIKEHFSIEIGSKISLHFSILHSINNGGLEFVAGVMPSFEQYLSLVYRF